MSVQEIKKLLTIVLEVLYEVCPKGDVAKSTLYLALKMDLSKTDTILSIGVKTGLLRETRSHRFGLTAEGRELVSSAIEQAKLANA